MVPSITWLPQEKVVPVVEMDPEGKDPGELDSGEWVSHPARVGEEHQERGFLLVATGDA